MARLKITSPELMPAELQLGPGRNVFGREGQLDFVLAHPSVSRTHCELVLMSDALLVRDLGSRNGTYIDGERVQVAHILTGQTLRLGDVEILVEEAPVHISVPDLTLPQPDQPTFMPDGAPCCLHHPGVEAKVQCTNCQHVFCTGCVRELRVAGGTPRRYCPDCGGACERLTPTVAKGRRGWLTRLKDVFTKTSSSR